MHLGGPVAAVVLLTSLAAPLAALAQGARSMSRVGIVAAASAATGRHQVDAFREGLRDLGYVDRQNIVIEERWAEGRPERFGQLIAELEQSGVDVIVVASAIGARAARQAAVRTPVVFVAVTDPVASGVVGNLARPGGNLTGTSLLIGEDLAGKWVELARDAFPRLSVLAALAHTDHPMTRQYVGGMESAARTLGLRLQVLDVPDLPGLDRALSSMGKSLPGALIVAASSFFGTHRKRIAEFARPRRIPVIAYEQQFVADGGLMSYGPSIADAYCRGARYVDRILKGTRPGDLPVEQSTRFELVVSLTTARALGVTLPPSLLARADHVIQ